MIYGKLVVRPHRGGRRARCSYRNTYIQNGRLGTSLRPVPLPSPAPPPPLTKAKRLFDFLIGLTPIFVIFFFFFASARFRSRTFWIPEGPRAPVHPPHPQTARDRSMLGLDAHSARSRFASMFSMDRQARSPSVVTRASSPSPSASRSDISTGTDLGRRSLLLGVCAMDVKARSKPMREILTRLVDRMKGAVEIKIFGDKVILDEGKWFPRLSPILDEKKANSVCHTMQMWKTGHSATSSFPFSLRTFRWTKP